MDLLDTGSTGYAKNVRPWPDLVNTIERGLRRVEHMPLPPDTEKVWLPQAHSVKLFNANKDTLGMPLRFDQIELVAFRPLFLRLTKGFKSKESQPNTAQKFRIEFASTKSLANLWPDSMSNQDEMNTPSKGRKMSQRPDDNPSNLRGKWGEFGVPELVQRRERGNTFMPEDVYSTSIMPAFTTRELFSQMRRAETLLADSIWGKDDFVFLLIVHEFHKEAISDDGFRMKVTRTYQFHRTSTEVAAKQCYVRVIPDEHVTISNMCPK